MHLHDELEQRGLLNQYTDEALFDLYDTGGQTLYVGMDPTADSLHLGNFVGFMHAIQYMKRGNHLIFIVGGATGMIGDPGGKDAERSFLDEATLANNVAAITQQVSTILDHLTEMSGYTWSFEVMNNLDFYRHMGYIDFLREVGKYITINQMMNKETVKRRIEDPDASISYTEFSYMLMQGYDYYRLYQDKGCRLQIAGSDQWGNIVTGIELIRKKTEHIVYGATCPLILDSTGKKFGKSEGNALWLDPEKNSPFVIYQYFMNTTDEDIARYLKLLTLLSLEDIGHILTTHEKAPEARIGQAALAYTVTQTIFGEQAAEHARAITELLFGTKDKHTQIQAMDPGAIRALHQATGGVTIQDDHIRIIDACTLTGLTSSNGEAKKALKEGVIYCNEQKITDPSYELQKKDAINDIILLRKGKKARRSVLFI